MPATVTFAVSAEKNRQLREKMQSVGMREEDLEEKFIRSSGKGGQHVNKTSTCVYLRHLPTGLEVKCMKDRSQSINRFLARRELVDRLEAMQKGHGLRDSRMEKLRKQKAKRRRRSVDKYQEAPEKE